MPSTASPAPCGWRRGWKIPSQAACWRNGPPRPGFRSIPPITIRRRWRLAKGYQVHSAVALEAQAFPNAPNVPSFPSAVLPLDTVYNQVTEYRFSVAP